MTATSVDLHLDDCRLDLLTEHVDVALRGGDLEDTGLITRALAPVKLVVCAAQGYLDRRVGPAAPIQLPSHECLDFAGCSTPGEWRFETPRWRRRRRCLLTLARTAALHFVRRPWRAPVSFYSRACSSTRMKRGRLRPLLTGYRPHCRPLQLLTHPDRQPTPKLRSFIDAIVRDLGPQGENPG